MNALRIKAHNIVKQYGAIKALKGVSCELYAGEIVSLLGINGAGKTTLSTIMGTLHPPTSGDIFYNGRSIYEDLPRFRKMLGYCPQKPNLNPLLSVKKNLFFAGRYFGMTDRQIEQRIEHLHEQLGIGRYLDADPPELSGGWKQRYMIARTLIHSPKLVILDEPTVALDPGVRNKLWEHIKQVKREGVSVLLTTHYLEEAEQLSDRVILLHEGEVKLTDTPENLKNSFKRGRLEDVFIELTNQSEEDL